MAYIKRTQLVATMAKNADCTRSWDGAGYNLQSYRRRLCCSLSCGAVQGEGLTFGVAACSGVPPAVGSTSISNFFFIHARWPALWFNMNKIVLKSYIELCGIFQTFTTILFILRRNATQSIQAFRPVSLAPSLSKWCCSILPSYWGSHSTNHIRTQWRLAHSLLTDKILLVKRFTRTSSVCE